MKGIVKKIELKEFKTKDGKKFKSLCFECDVKIDDKGNIQTLKGNYSEEFARKYFKYCDVKTKDIINKEVECIPAKREYTNDKGETRVYKYIKFMNILDKDGNAITMPKDDVEELDF